MNVGFFNKELLKSVSASAGWLFGVIGALLSFVDFKEQTKKDVLIGFVLLTLVFYMANSIINPNRN